MGSRRTGYDARMQSDQARPMATQRPDPEPDQDAEPPGTGIPGPVHSDEPAEGAESG
jgi:hypothetical protein